MKVNAIQNETFGSNISLTNKAVNKGYSILVNGQKYVVGASSDHNNAISSFLKGMNNFSKSANTNKLNVIA